ncbi:hypothetical protein BDN72DRAFT_839478 [Pluteus cervinus]|uniref:Uncharacterized protein n=1 Tax=Pluteus cervinus TaxID=181527 RepID=A0ACD3AXH2_9AGAR|nr:hypothetical protein BDN72DRAFT_839478 [Pluteus cervinus]
MNVTNGMTPHSWRGPIMTMRQNAHIYDHPNKYEDITLEDFRDIVDYFVMYCRGDPMDVPQEPPKKIKGVKLNCHGDMKAYDVPQFTSVDVPNEHPGFHAELSQLSRDLGLPLRLYKYAADPRWRSIDETSTPPSRNEIAANLMVELDPEVPQWGTIPLPKWQKDSKINSVLLVRDDRKDLTVQQAEALCTYCESKIIPAIRGSLDNPGSMARSEVMQLITPAKYKEFFAWLCEERGKKDEKWKGKLSPF